MGESDIAAISTPARGCEHCRRSSRCGEHQWLDLVQGGREGFAGFVARESGRERVIAYAQISRGNGRNWAVEYVVHPQWRSAGVELQEDLLPAGSATSWSRAEVMCTCGSPAWAKEVLCSDRAAQRNGWIISCLRHPDLGVCLRDAAFGGGNVGTAFEQLRGNPKRESPRVLRPANLVAMLKRWKLADPGAWRWHVPLGRAGCRGWW